MSRVRAGLGFRVQVRAELEEEALATFRELYPIFEPFQAHGSGL